MNYKKLIQFATNKEVCTMKRSIDTLIVSPTAIKKTKEEDPNSFPTPPDAGIENEVINRRLVNAYGTCKQTTTFVDFKQEMIFNLKVGAQDIRIQLIKTDPGIARWCITRGEAWAVHHRNGMMISISKVIEFNALLIGSHVSCNISVPGGPAFAWKISCCLGGPSVEKVQIQ
jgi:hypothetical protein